MICLSKSYLDSTTSSGNTDLHILDCSYFRIKHPNKKGISVLIYYKSVLPKKKIETISLPESVYYKLKLKRKIWRFLSF